MQQTRIKVFLSVLLVLAIAIGVCRFFPARAAADTLYIVTITKNVATLTAENVSSCQLTARVTNFGLTDFSKYVQRVDWASSNTDILNVRGTSLSPIMSLGGTGMGGPVTISVDVELIDPDGNQHLLNGSMTIDVLVPVIRFTTPESPMVLNETRTLTVEKYPVGAPIFFESSDPACISVSSTAATSGDTMAITANAISATPTTITAYFKDHDKTAVYATYEIPSVKQVPTLRWNLSVLSLTAGNSLSLKTYLNYPDALENSLKFSSTNLPPSVMLTASSGLLATSTDASGVITISVSSSETNDFFAGGPAEIKIYLGQNYGITAADTAMRVNVGDTGTTDITKESGAGAWDISSSNPTGPQQR